MVMNGGNVYYLAFMAVIGVGVILVLEIGRTHQLLSEKDQLIINKDQLIIDKDQLISKKNQLLSDPEYNKEMAKIAFQKAEEWRLDKVQSIYLNVSMEELLVASRYLQYADPFSQSRSCESLPIFEWLSNESLIEIGVLLESIFSDHFTWSEKNRRDYLTMHAFHTTGIEGNTLTLPETSMVVNGIQLFAGFRDDMVTPQLSTSIKEVRNIQIAIDMLSLSSPQQIPMWSPLTIQSLVDINAVIIRDMKTRLGLRDHEVAVGQQLIVLPLSQEVPWLLQHYVDWLNSAMHGLISSELDLFGTISKALAVACDAHTRFVHIHPFSDGNGRLARLLSGMVLKSIGLQAPMFVKEDRQSYIKAVGKTTIGQDPSALCTMHGEAVLRSLRAIERLCNETASASASALAATAGVALSVAVE